MRTYLAAVFAVPLLLAAAANAPAPDASTSCLSIIPLYGTETQTVGTNSTGNMIDFYVTNETPGEKSVTATVDAPHNFSSVQFYGGSNPFDLVYLGSLDAGYTFDTNAFTGNFTITVTATASCGYVSQDFDITVS